MSNRSHLTLLWTLTQVWFTVATSTEKTNVHVINLDKDTARWQSVTKELQAKGVSESQIHRVAGVYGKHLSKEQLQTNASPIARLFCTRGTIGCYLSHRSFWQKTLEEDDDMPYQMVLEDDVLVCDEFLTRVQDILNELNDNNETSDYKWDVLLLGALGCCHPEGKHGFNRIAALMAGGGRTRRRVTPHCHIPRRPMGMHAYLLTKRGAEKLLKRAWLASGHVDVVAWGMPELDILCCDTPMLAHQAMASPSTIGAVTSGIETFIPKIEIDGYTGITLEWAFNAPVLRIPGLDVVLTMGRSIVYVVGGFVLALLLRGNFPWLLPVHTAVFVMLVVITKLTTQPLGCRPSSGSKLCP